jgi:hypothetical protein
MTGLVFLFALFGIQAHAAKAPDPQGLLKAMLNPFEAKVEQITGIPSCEDELSQMIDALGALIAENSTDRRLGAVAEEAYNGEIREYRQERLTAVGLTFDERVQKLRQMVPQSEPYSPAKIETPESKRVDFTIYLTTEFSKLEKSAIVNRGIRDLEDAMSPTRRVKPFEIYYFAGDKGRACRLILFLRDSLTRLEVDYEEGFKAFAEAFLTPEIIRESLGVQQYQNTQALFCWLKDHNPVLYFFFLEKYQPFTSEEFLLDVTE